MSLSISDSTRKKRAAKAQALLPEARVIAYAEGVSGPDPRKVMLGMLGGAVAICAVLAVVTGMVFFPGLLLIFVVKNALNKPATLVVDAFGLALLTRSSISGSPEGVVLRVSAQQVPALERRGSRSRLVLQDTQIWLNKAETRQLLDGFAAAVDQARGPAVAA